MKRKQSYLPHLKWNTRWHCPAASPAIQKKSVLTFHCTHHRSWMNMTWKITASTYKSCHLLFLWWSCKIKFYHSFNTAFFSESFRTHATNTEKDWIINTLYISVLTDIPSSWIILSLKEAVLPRTFRCCCINWDTPTHECITVLSISHTHKCLSNVYCVLFACMAHNRYILFILLGQNSNSAPQISSREA